MRINENRRFIAKIFTCLLTALLLAAFTTDGGAQERRRRGGPTVQIKGQVMAFDGSSLTVKSISGETIKLNMPKNPRVYTLAKATISEIKKGDFIASAGMRQKDGTIYAVEVRIFPEKMRGRGEGHRPFRGGAESTMTNATVDAFVGSVKDRMIKVKYPKGEKIIKVGENVPIMRMGLSSKKLLKPGAQVSIRAQKSKGGTLTAIRVLVGKDGFVPPF